MVVTDAQTVAALAQYDNLIHKLAWHCLRKMPRTTMYTEQDLHSEGQEQLLRVLDAYDPRRGTRLITLLHVSLCHRYGHLLRREWDKRGTFRAAPAAAVARLTEPPGQEAHVLAGDIFQFPDRYRHLTAPGRDEHGRFRKQAAKTPRPPR